MKVVLALAASVDGKITKWDDIQNVQEWTSREDKQFFSSMIKKSDVMIMGSGTYQAVKKNLNFDLPILRLVLTKTPEKYKEDEKPGQLEFINSTPKELIDAITKLNPNQVLLAAGSRLSSQFLMDGLIDEFYLTIEPKIFGTGKPMFEDRILDINLKLVSIKKMNERGTLLIHYKKIV
ncbi:hypothetical protein A3C23_03885 [Candidatus Roizmanbacteria bacterium RIFCSPHIGHO2_02_FULL_37_13b]|uniref:Bacterial bifunctional deaminase-reductase C-terminal domain-containing protein n=1 Tax=Candidatus Roizmanbacteria bacterium RIFCSPLOWO2_02_FULL_36_11 TaxID=1802071 RepID=A0A1F7JC49_9BACT|nr:MAG: hypothetical protein A3C23_03885 [Candidatus Roizmanbacteria bacterium RIFCSPHIGHO2_02_FULL_37_13b]OGK53171.1 MAG: hypothetical protein A3H78_06185 [Candidatus Roizmanbacteria bacterium RIFCSPLOWO2_02_FULL_36_11]